ncbi:MAG: Com family DNA-binding transcriptional regulator [Brachymonas sp.]|nr:Com family DNA-binding transcriptional regulator [Brachymonas sp.]
MKTQDIRCNQCGKKLAEGLFVRLSIKCPRCRATNDLSTQSASECPQPKGAHHDATHNKHHRPLPHPAR